MTYVDFLKIAMPVLSAFLLSAFGFIAFLIRSLAILTTTISQLTKIVDELSTRVEQHDARMRAVEIDQAICSARGPCDDLTPTRRPNRGTQR